MTPHYPTADELADMRERAYGERLCDECGLPDDPWPHPYPGTALATDGIPLGTPVRRRPAVVILLESRDQAAT